MKTVTVKSHNILKITVSDNFTSRKNENLIGDLIDCLKELRNAIAHNGVLFDCRFKENSVGKRLTEHFNIRMNVEDTHFNRIVDYLAVIILISASLGYNKSELRNWAVKNR